MQRGLILTITTVMVFVAIGVQGTSHLSFANDTQVSITRDGCGTTKLCVEAPENCDPAGKNACLFTSINASKALATNGVKLVFELSGNSTGYIAVGLMSKTKGTTMLFICAQDTNGTFFFRTMKRNNSNNELTGSEMNVTEIRGVVKDNLIQCEFNVPNVNATTTTRSSQDTTFIIILGSGEVNGTELGKLNVTRSSNPLDVTNPSSGTLTTTPATSTTNTTANVTTATTTESGASGAAHPHAALLLLSVLTLLVLKTD